MDEASGHESDEVYQDGAVTEYNSDNTEDSPHKQGPAKSKDQVETNPARAKWKRLTKSYNDQYLELFNDSFRQGDVDEPLEVSQLGSIIWTSYEKRKFFDALARNGCRNLTALSDAVQTKSQVEIIEYVRRLKEAEVERQMFSVHAKNVSHPEIEAAIEIEPALDRKLDDAADALAAFQDYYDYAEAKLKYQGVWVIDSTAAAELADDHNDEKDEATEEDDTKVVSSAESAVELFRFDALIDLSAKLFMNMPEHRLHGHWQDYTEEDEEPAITIDAARDMYLLVKSLTQRVLQSAIFLAESRLRSMTRTDYSPTRIVKDIDIAAALDVLKMPSDSWDYWTGFAARNGLKIVLGGNSKRERNDNISLQKAKDILAVRATRGRRRSLSRLAELMSAESAPLEAGSGQSEEVENHSGHLDDDGFESVQESQELDQYHGSDTAHVPTAGSSSNFHGSDSEHESDMDVDSSGDTGTSNNAKNAIHVSRRRRRRLMEEAEDDFMERLDRANSISEAKRLRALLGFTDEDPEVAVDLGRRPRKMRKTEADLQDWTKITFRETWEHPKQLQEGRGRS